MVERRDAGRSDSHQYFPIRDCWFLKLDELQSFITNKLFRSHGTHVSFSFSLSTRVLIPLLFRLTHSFDPPSLVASLRGEAAIDQQTVAGHERRLCGRKPDGRVGDLFGLADASDGMQGRHLGAEFGLLAGKAVKHVGIDYRRQNSVHADALLAELQG